jgi:hypothetical protein
MYLRLLWVTMLTVTQGLVALAGISSSLQKDPARASPNYSQEEEKSVARVGDRLCLKVLGYTLFS